MTEIQFVVNLIERQKDITVLIENKRANAVRYGARKNKRAFRRIWNEIQTLWTEFLTNDLLLNEALEKDGTILEQPYFKEKKKAMAEGIFTKATEYLTSCFPEIELPPEGEDLNNKDDDDEIELEDDVSDEATGIKLTDNVSDESTMNQTLKWSVESAEEDERNKLPKPTGTIPKTKRVNIDKTSTFLNQPSAADFALMKISEVLATQQMFQQQIQEQMAAMMQSAQGRNQREGLRGPVVEIPEFSGDLLLYSSFKDTFETITQKCNLSKIEKFTILKTKCTDLAENYISHVTLAEGNYERAWKILDDRFDDPVQIISTCVDSILDMPAIPPNDAIALEKALNKVQQVGSNLELLKINPNQVVLIRAIIRKLDDNASGELTRFIGNHKEYPSYEKLINFFIHHLSILRARVPVAAVRVDERRPENKDRSPKSNSNSRQHTTKSHATLTSDGASYRCYICFEAHLAPACPKLAASTTPYDLLKHYNICSKCVSHKFNKRKPCIRKISCDICKAEHLTVLHGKQIQEENANSFLCANGGSSTSPDCVLLPTAVAKFLGKDFNIEKRILIDVCSQASYVEEQIVQALKLKKMRCDVNIAGVGGEITGKVKSMTTLRFEVIYPEKRILEVKAYVVKRVTRKLPSVPKDFRSFTGFDKPLADSYMGQPSHVPILLGANIASELFLEGIFTYGGLLLQNTRLGWIVMGSEKSDQLNSRSIVSTHVSVAEFQQELAVENFEDDLKRFWDIPVSKEDIEIIEENVCEELFKAKCYQQEDGRYVVPTPWKQNSPVLGNSYSFALKCFLSQERRLAKNPSHKKMSDEFMQDYISMGHMSPIPSENHAVTNGDVYYVPYHSILRQDAVTTKLRNVFNASAKTSTGVSLNQTIHPGPTLQSKIFDVITRIRQYQYIYSSDITKMYRQILLLEEDRSRLRILYREKSNIPLKEYSLNTITYGIDCAPWQAIRTIHQVARDHAPNEEILEIITKSFYMDDLFHGADSIEDCQQQIFEITNVLNKGKLPLTKWMSNNPEVLKNVDKNRKLECYVDLKSESAAVKTLGIQYFPRDDMFGFKVKKFDKLKFTKRGMLSMTASLYDPLGWILPVIMRFRILIQKMWTVGLDWDDRLEPKMEEQFKKFIDCLPVLEQLRIPRWMGSFKSDEVELIGFCDASGDGFAAVVYSRIKTPDSYNVTLIASKGRVTPLKTKKNLDSKLCTIPKMELEGLCLLSELFKELKPNFAQLKLTLTAYTDSQVVLAWIRSAEEIDNKFVRRRVQKIKKVLVPGDVHYVKSAENPADAASRGLAADEFMNKIQLWTEGPVWMKADLLPTTPFQRSEVLITNATQVESSYHNDFIPDSVEKFSSLDKLIGCVSVILMWFSMFRKKFYKPTKTAQQVTEARQQIIALQQQHSFAKEITTIRKGERLRKGHWMSFLCPYLDQNGILRVGGRLDRAIIPKDQKHPMIIPKSHLARLIIRDIHWKNKHSPNALTDRLLKERYWITGSRNIIRSEIRQCNYCIRFGQPVSQPQMSDLPLERLKSSHIFECTSVDFAGPFSIRASKIKYDRSIKVWVSIFVCMSTKLAHLEICTELSAENFLAAFDRFSARRSTPGLMVSDNGTNFVAANKILAQQFEAMVKKGISVLATREIEWRFIPPGSPHFGGLHEACVKSFKYFVKRMAHVDHLTYEDFNTLICRIEALLNSRPLYPLSTDPNDELALTPGHFAVQRCLTAPPSCPSSRKTIPITKKWVIVQQLQSGFWEIFTKEYLSTLQKRYKWIHPQYNFKLDDVVIIKEHLTHPLDWPLGRVVKCYPDEKGIVRKVDLFGKNRQTLHRAVNKLIPLITEEEEQQINSPKRSTRSRKTNMSLVTTALMCLMVFCGSTRGFNVEVLSPGIHVRKIAEVNLKNLNILFALQTNVNVTEDIKILDDHALKFSQFCESMNLIGNMNVSRFCTERHEFLQREITLMKANILGLYASSRRPRSLSMLSKFTFGGLMKKAGPYAMMAATAGWQEYENWKITKKLHDVEHKFNKVSFILLNITDTETSSLQRQLDNLVDQQRQIILEAEVMEFFTSIQSLMDTIEIRHQNLITIRPVDELNDYVKRLNNLANIVKLPALPNPEDIFTFFPIQRYVESGVAVLEFDIVLCRPDVFVKYAVISIPENDDLLFLDNDDIVQVICASADNSSYFYPDESTEVFPSIFDEVHLQLKSSCTASILRHENFHGICRHGHWTPTAVFNPIGPNEVVVFNYENMNISLICDNELLPITGNFSIIDHQGCVFQGVNNSNLLQPDVKVSELSPHMNLIDDFVPLEIDQATVHSTREQISQLKQELGEILRNDAESTDLFSTLPEIILISLLLMLFLVLIIVISKTRHEDRSRDIALQSWTTGHQQ